MTRAKRSKHRKETKVFFINFKAGLLIVMFVSMLIVPWGIVQIFGIKSISFENRPLKGKPEFSFDTIVTYPKEFEAYYNDHIPFKDKLVTANTYINYKYLDISPEKYVIKGSNGWLFYDSKYRDDMEDTIADYRRTNLYSKEELEDIKNKMLEKQQYLKSKGIELYLLIAPNKSQIFSEYMPRAYTKLSEKSRADLLVEYLRANTDIKVIYPKDELIKAKEKYPIYYKIDTHWNEVGAYVGYSEFMKASGRGNMLKPMDQLSLQPDKDPYLDLAKLISINLFEKESNSVRFNYKDDIKVECTYNIDKILKYKSSSPNKEKVIMFRDSFGEALANLLAKDFQDTIIVHDPSFNRKLIEQEKPKIVIMEFVERRIELLKKI